MPDLGTTKHEYSCGADLWSARAGWKPAPQYIHINTYDQGALRIMIIFCQNQDRQDKRMNRIRMVMYNCIQCPESCKSLNPDHPDSDKKLITQGVKGSVFSALAIFLRPLRILTRARKVPLPPRQNYIFCIHKIHTTTPLYKFLYL